MNKMEKSEHVCVVDKEGWVCDAQVVLREIKFFMKEYYMGFYSEDGEGLCIKLNNSKKFLITVKELN